MEKGKLIRGRRGRLRRSWLDQIEDIWRSMGKSLKGMEILAELGEERTHNPTYERARMKKKKICNSFIVVLNIFRFLHYLFRLISHYYQWWSQGIKFTGFFHGNFLVQHLPCSYHFAKFAIKSSLRKFQILYALTQFYTTGCIGTFYRSGVSLVFKCRPHICVKSMGDQV